MVIILGVLIVVVVVAIIWAIFNLDDADDAAAPVAAPAPTPPLRLSLGIPPACTIADMQLDGRRLAVRTHDPTGAGDCARIYIVDTSSGNVTATVAP